MSLRELLLDHGGAGLWVVAVGAMANVSCALLGCYLVLRRLSLLGDAISHAVLPGIVVAFLLSGKTAILPMFIGAVVVGLLTAFLTQTLHSFGKVPEDASMGVVFTSLFALGVLLIVRFASDIDLDPDCVLYGLLEFVAVDTFSLAGREVPRAAQSLSIALVATLLLISILWKELKIVAFDPVLATAMGFSAIGIHYTLMGMVAVVTVASFEAVGSILVIAMLIVPGAAAHLLTDRLAWMMVWAACIAALSSLVGYLAAAYWNTSVAGMMAVVAGVQFSLAVFLAPRHGLIGKALRSLQLSLRVVSEDIVALLYRLEELPSHVIGQTASQGVGQAGGWNACVQAAGGGPIGWLAVQRLWRRGEVRWFSPGELRLTDRGRKRAQSIVRSHRLWEAYLGEHFDLPLDHLHASAERIEHFIGPELQERLAEELQAPLRDPHGREIPSPPLQDT